MAWIDDILKYRAETNIGLVDDPELGPVSGITPGTGGYVVAPDGQKYTVPRGTTAPVKPLTTAPKLVTTTARTGAATTPARTSQTTPQINALLKSLSATLGGYTDAATGEMRNKQEESESLLRSQLAKLQNDPTWRYARTAALQAAQNPGIDPALLARMRGRAAANAAAATAAGARSLMANLARGNIRGPGAVNALQMNNNRGEVARTNQAVGIDQWAAENEQQNKARALAQLMSVLQTTAGNESALTGQLAATKGRYDPLSWLQKINGIMAPLSGLGTGIGLQNRPGTLPPVEIPGAGPTPVEVGTDVGGIVPPIVAPVGVGGAGAAKKGTTAKAGAKTKAAALSSGTGQFAFTPEELASILAMFQ